MFRIDNLGLDNLSGGLSMDKIDSFSLSSHRFPIALHLVMGPWNTCSNHIGMLAAVTIIQVLFGQPYYLDFMDIASRSCLEVIISLV